MLEFGSGERFSDFVWLFYFLFFIVWMLGFEIWDLGFGIWHCFELLELWFEEIEEIEEGRRCGMGEGKRVDLKK